MRIARRLALGRLISLSGGSAAYIALVATIVRFDRIGSLGIGRNFLERRRVRRSAAPAGWIGDRFNRRAVLIGTDVAAATVSLAMAGSAHHPVALVILLGVSSIVVAPFEPASAAAIPNVVPARDVPRANALVASTSSAGYLVGSS